jgi:hypothetical protein
MRTSAEAAAAATAMSAVAKMDTDESKLPTAESTAADDSKDEPMDITDATKTEPDAGVQPLSPANGTAVALTHNGHA